MTPPPEFTALFYCMTIIAVAMTAYQIYIWRKDRITPEAHR